MNQAQWIALAGTALAACLPAKAPEEVPATPPPVERPLTGAFGPTLANNTPAPASAPDRMVWIPGGEFSMGLEDPSNEAALGTNPMNDARPIHRVYVDGFWMDRTAVTNEEFARFVKATGYITVAERTPTLAEFPTAPPENLYAGSTVFSPPDRPVPLDTQYRWWSYVKNAAWRHPRGAGSSIHDHDPVVQIAYEDAEAYAKWAGKRLPTEAEYEFAARGGLAGQRFAWGNEMSPDGKTMANTFQGHFPDNDSGADGWAGIAPVGSFPPNAYGLYDITGNVWEWCSDWYRPDYYSELANAGVVVRNPQGPESSFDPAEPGEPKRVQRGGSFLCTSQYCSRYLVGARGKGEISTGANHLGFRCVKGL